MARASTTRPTVSVAAPPGDSVPSDTSSSWHVAAAGRPECPHLRFGRPSIMGLHDGYRCLACGRTIYQAKASWPEREPDRLIL